MNSPTQLIRKVLGMSEQNTENPAAGTGVAFDGTATGASTNGGTGDGAATNNGAAAGAGSAGDSGAGANAGTGSGTNTNAGDGSGSADGADGHGFDGPFDPERARKLIDKLKQEKADLRELLDAKPKEGATSETPKAEPKAETDSEAIAEVRKLREELNDEKRINRFRQFAESQGMHPAAVEMAFQTSKDSMQYGSDGISIMNATTIVESLKTSTPFMFGQSTQGQQGRGSAGGSTGGSTGGGTMLTADEDIAAKAFGMTREQYIASRDGIKAK